MLTIVCSFNIFQIYIFNIQPRKYCYFFYASNTILNKEDKKGYII